ncbi:MAG: hypothetical protein V1824_04470, partial [archaeon]
CKKLNLYLDKSTILMLTNSDVGLNYNNEDIKMASSFDLNFHKIYDYNDMLIYCLAQKQEIDEIITYNDDDFKECKIISDIKDSNARKIEIYHPYDYIDKFIKNKN